MIPAPFNRHGHEGDTHVKAFWTAMAAMILIAVGAAVVLTNLEMSSADVFQSQRGGVRL
jgi:hypothetical protein